MSNHTALTISMTLLIAAFPLISIGTTQGSPLLWQLGFLALVVGGVIPPVRRFFAAPEPAAQPRRYGHEDDERV